MFLYRSLARSWGDKIYPQNRWRQKKLWPQAIEVFEQLFSRLPWFHRFIPRNVTALGGLSPQVGRFHLISTCCPPWNYQPTPLKISRNPRGKFRGKLLVSGRVLYSFPTRTSKWNSDPVCAATQKWCTDHLLFILKRDGYVTDNFIWNSGSPLHPRVFFVGVSDPKQPFFEGISGVTGSNHINHTVDWKKSYTTSFLLNPFKEMGHSPYQLVIRISSIKCMCRFVLYILCSHQKYPCGTFLSSLLSEKNNKNHTLRSHTCPLQDHFFPSTSLIKALINFKVSLIDITSEISGILKLHDCYNPPKN